jgi:methylated-DNA-protein-cysteine methyltransferase related protein
VRREPPNPRVRRPTFFSAVYAAVRRVPRGRVVTYGAVARLLGVPRGARAVGWALRVLPPRLERDVPWHRVVGAGGRIAIRSGPGSQIQVRRLRAEGVRIEDGRVDMARHAVS